MNGAAITRYFGFSIALTATALIVGLVFGGPAALLSVVVLGVLEVCLSFDNAVVNAKVLARMSPFWRKMFLYVGIFIAVFVMRAFLPILLVAVTASLSLGDVFSLALNYPDTYAHHVEDASEAIYTFGGVFLLMVFLNFVLDEEKDSHWLAWLERPLAKIGKLDTMAVLIALVAIFIGAEIADPEKFGTVWAAGGAGLATYLAVQILNQIMEGDEDEDENGESVPGPTGNSTNGPTKAVATAGLGAFLYLEVLDASFSFDGVIGAFAISSNIFVILLGLGVGAFWVRSLTIFMVDRGTLEQYRYLEHGAMWAIGVLAVIMFAELRFHISEYVTGLTGVVFIIAAVITSIVVERRETAAEAIERSVDDRDDKVLV
jgi:uncharacterized protein